MRTRLFIPLVLSALLAACASDGNIRISGGIGSFGSGGGVSVGGSTDVATSSHKNPLPFEQLFLEQPVIDALFPERELPFTAEEADIKALNDYARSDAAPNVSDAEKEQISLCRSGKARCRVQARPAET